MGNKKFLTLAITATFVLSSFAPFAGATTVEELQAQINALLQQIAALQGTTVTTGTPLCLTKNLKLGMTDAEVKTLQQGLNKDTATTVATTGAGSLGNETTYYGTLTQAAVIKFQEKYAADILAPLGLTKGTGIAASATRTKFNALYCTPTTPITPATTTTTSAAALSVAIASDTPAGGNVRIGEANKIVTKFTITAPADADLTITSVKVKSFGTSQLNAQDVASVKMFDGNDQIGLTQVLVNGYAYFTFAPALKITKGTSKTYGIGVTMATAAAGTAVPSGTVIFGIEKATDFTASSTLTGTFPLKGNTFVIVAGGAIGTLNVAGGAVVPTVTTYVGAKDVVLGNIIVSAGTNEDVYLTQFNINYGGAATILDSDVTNIRVKVDGTVQGSASAFTNQRAVINFSTPISLPKGNVKTFQVIGDISNGAGRIIELRIPIDCVIGYGATTGAGIGGPVAAANLGLANRINIGAGTLAVSASTATPQGANANVVISTVPQVLGVYDIRPIGEDMIINRIGIYLSSGANNGNLAGGINSVGLYDANGALLSQLVNVVADNTTNPDGWDTNGAAGADTIIFNMNWQVAANTTTKLYIKGVTNVIQGPAAAPVIVTLADADAATAGVQSIIATGLSSAGQAGPNNITSNSVLALPGMTINQGPNFLVAGDAATTSYNQAVFSPVTQAKLGTIRITAQREDQELRGIRLEIVDNNNAFIDNDANAATHGADLILSGVALFDSTNQITRFITPGFDGADAGVVIGDTAGEYDTVQITAADILVPTTFTLNTPKTLDIIANVISPLPAQGQTLRFRISQTDGNTTTLDGLLTIGKSSGALAESSAAAAVALTTNVGSFNEGGTYTMRANVVEVKPSADTPSGAIARGTFATVAKFDLDAKTAGGNLDISRILMTSTVGLPSTILATDNGMFRLYDVDNNTPIASSAIVNQANGTVEFAGIAANALQLAFGVTRHIALQVTTTNAAKWPTSTSMQWSIRSLNDANVGIAGVGILAGGTAVDAADPDVGQAVASVAAGSLVRFTDIGGGAVYNNGVDGVYVDTDNSGTITAGDRRLIIGNAAGSGAGFGVGTICAAGDADVVAATAFAAANADANVTKTGTNNVAFVYGRDGLYYNTSGGAVTPVAATDIRLAPMGTWAGFGGTYYIPATANTVTISG